MGRAGWGLLFMTLVSLAIATHGIYEGASVGNAISSSSSLDRLFDSNSFTQLSRSSGFDYALYEYLDPNSTSISSSSFDYYASSFSYTRTALNFLKDFFVPSSILLQIDGFPSILVWVFGILWNMIYALLIFEVVWRFNIFD